MIVECFVLPSKMSIIYCFFRETRYGLDTLWLSIVVKTTEYIVVVVNQSNQY